MTVSAAICLIKGPFLWCLHPFLLKAAQKRALNGCEWLIIFSLHFYYMYLLCVWRGVHTTACIWRLEENLQDSDLSFQNVCPRNQATAVAEVSDTLSILRKVNTPFWLHPQCKTFTWILRESLIIVFWVIKGRGPVWGRRRPNYMSLEKV